MTSLVPELEALPDGLAVDGELVAFGDDGLPSFPRLCDRMLHGKRRIEVMLIVFDVFAIDGRDVTRRPYWERRQLLEGLALDGDHWSATPAYADGESLWERVVDLGIEGVVSKKRSGHYLPGGRGWIKTKNRAYWRYPLEVEAARHPKDREGGGPVDRSKARSDALPAIKSAKRGHWLGAARPLPVV